MHLNFRRLYKRLKVGFWLFNLFIGDRLSYRILKMKYRWLMRWLNSDRRLYNWLMLRYFWLLLTLLLGSSSRSVYRVL